VGDHHDPVADPAGATFAVACCVLPMEGPDAVVDHYLESPGGTARAPGSTPIAERSSTVTGEVTPPRLSCVDGLRQWLREGTRERSARKSSAWHLARRAVVLIAPRRRGEVVWKV
jgi:hypothetical protein